jgi:hypothetical protein
MRITPSRGAGKHWLAVPLAALAALVAAPPAAAHSVLIATEPERDAIVQEPPTRKMAIVERSTRLSPASCPHHAVRSAHP